MTTIWQIQALKILIFLQSTILQFTFRVRQFACMCVKKCMVYIYIYIKPPHFSRTAKWKKKEALKDHSAAAEQIISKTFFCNCCSRPLSITNVLAPNKEHCHESKPLKCKSNVYIYYTDN